MKNKQAILRVINPIMFLLVLYQGVTGFFRLNMYDHFKAVHPLAGALLILLVVLHLILNWPWVKSQYLKKRR